MRATNLTVLSFLLRLAASCSLTGHTILWRQNDTRDNSVERRWSHIPIERYPDEIDPKSPSFIPWGNIWKDNTILWCFDYVPEWEAVGVDVMRRDIAAAWDLWIAAGIDAQVMTFREGTVEECQGTNILKIERGSLASIVGKTDNKAAVMYLNDLGSAALGDRVANFAHEIGQ